MWVVRFANHRPLRFHGLDRNWACNVSDALATVRSVWFMNGENELERSAVAAALGNLTFLQVCSSACACTVSCTIEPMLHHRAYAATIAMHMVAHELCNRHSSPRLLAWAGAPVGAPAHALPGRLLQVPGGSLRHSILGLARCCPAHGVAALRAPHSLSLRLAQASSWRWPVRQRVPRCTFLASTGLASTGRCAHHPVHS